MNNFKKIISSIEPFFLFESSKWKRKFSSEHSIKIFDVITFTWDFLFEWLEKLSRWCLYSLFFRWIHLLYIRKQNKSILNIFSSFTILIATILWISLSGYDQEQLRIVLEQNNQEKQYL